MSLSIFGEKAVVPNEKMLVKALAGSKAIWDDIKSHVAAICGNVSEQWKYYSKKAGWSLVIKSGERTIIYLIPLEACFKVNYVFGEKAVAAAETAGIPKSVIIQIREATPYAEGRSFMMDVKSKADADTVKRLINIKYQN